MKKIALIDLFCGAGGTTTGVERAKIFGKKVAKVIACVNHDAMAIKSHRSNHKGVLHFTEDIRTLDLKRLIRLANQYREKGYTIAIWASLECTNFSNAKGGQPRDADSRTLAEHLFRYIYDLNPSYIFIENVREFMSWGALDNNGKPLSRDKGKDYMRWTNEICLSGYSYDWKILDSADYGAHTSRKRYFGIFAKESLPISFPKATHAKNPQAVGLFEEPLKKWKPVKEVLDLNDEGKSIFNRKKDLSPKTLERIYAGLLKYVAGGEKEFIAKYFSGRPKGKVISINGPAGTIKTSDGQSLIKTVFLSKYHGNGDNILSIDDTCSTVTTKDRLAKVHVKHFMDEQYGKSKCASIDNPSGTLVNNPKQVLISAKQFIDKMYSSSGNPEGQNSSIESPAGSLTTVNKQNLVTAKPFIMNTHFGNGPSSVEEPHKVITANRKHSYLINPSWFGNPGSINEPCCTIVARQDKAPLYFVMTEQSEHDLAIPVFENDCETMIKIKEFMVLYNIIDIKMRMLKVNELLKIQGFPKGYILEGNQSQQKKFIGNSVVPKIAEVIIKEIYRVLFEYTEFKKAA